MEAQPKIQLPPIPAKRYFTIGEVSELCGVKPHVLRYWEEQFPMLRPVKRSGARRYYRPDDIAMLERIDRLVHAEGYTLRGARQLLEAEARHLRQAGRHHAAASAPGRDPPRDTANVPIAQFADGPTSTAPAPSPGRAECRAWLSVRR